MKNIKNNIMYIITAIFIIFTIIFFAFAFYQRNVYANRYEQAQRLIKEEKFDEAVQILDTLKDYKDANELKTQAESGLIYSEATICFQNGNYIEAIEKFSLIPTYSDSIVQITEAKYQLALIYYEQAQYDLAKELFVELNNYSDSAFYLAQIDIKNHAISQQIVYEKAIEQFEMEEYAYALELFESIIDYSNAKEMAEECKCRIMRKNSNNSIAGGIRCSVAISNDHTVLAVGANPEGQCNVAAWRNIISVDTYGCFTIGLDTDGNVQLAGKYDGKNIDISEWKNITDIAAGERFIVGLKKDGTVVADGHNREHQIDVTAWNDVIAIDAGWNFTAALTQNNELLFAGVDNGQQDEFNRNKQDWIDVVNISSSGGGNVDKCRGKGHTVGLKKDGTVVAVGDNTYGQCDVTTWKDIIKVATGDWYTVGLKSDGSILITGTNTPGNQYIDTEILNECTDIIDIAAGFGHTLCLKKDGTVLAFGFNDDGKCSKTLEWHDLLTP